MKKQQKLPGTLWVNRNLWNWRVKLPGDAARRSIALKRAGSDVGIPATAPRAVAEAAAWRLLGEARAGKVATSQKRYTLTSLVDEYLQLARSKHRNVTTGEETSRVHNIKTALSDLSVIHGKNPPQSVNGQSMDALVDRWVQRDLSQSTVEMYLGVVARFYAWLLSRDIVDYHCEAVVNRYAAMPHNREKARKTKPVRPVDPQVVRALMDGITPTLRDMVTVHYVCGMRSDEVCSMRPMDILTNEEPWLYEPGHDKNKHRGIPRVVAILPEVRQIIEARMANRKSDQPLFSAAGSYRESLMAKHAKRRTPMNQGNKPRQNPMIRAGQRYTTASYGSAIRKASAKLAKAKWPGKVPKSKDDPRWQDWQQHLAFWRFTPHQLRHAAGTRNRAAAGRDIAAVLLGHAKGSDVTDIYTREAMVDEARREARQAVRDAAKSLRRGSLEDER